MKKLPDISEEISTAAKPRVNTNLAPRLLPENTISDGARVIGEKWQSNTQLPVPETKVERSPMMNARFECPLYLDKQISRMAVEEGVTKSFIILRALSAGGLDVKQQDLNRDRRKYRD
jgi:hypothetical protein